MPYSAITHDSRHPFETHALFGAAWMGAVSLLTQTWPYSLREGFPYGMRVAWTAFILVGSIVALFGIGWKKRPSGLLMEQVGLITLAVSLISYAITIFVYNSPVGLGIGGFLFAVGIACIRQWWRIEKSIRATLAVVAEMKKAEARDE